MRGSRGALPQGALTSTPGPRESSRFVKVENALIHFAKFFELRFYIAQQSSLSFVLSLSFAIVFVALFVVLKFCRCLLLSSCSTASTTSNLSTYVTACFALRFMIHAMPVNRPAVVLVVVLLPCCCCCRAAVAVSCWCSCSCSTVAVLVLSLHCSSSCCSTLVLLSSSCSPGRGDTRAVGVTPRARGDTLGVTPSALT